MDEDDTMADGLDVVCLGVVRTRSPPSGAGQGGIGARPQAGRAMCTSMSSMRVQKWYEALESCEVVRAGG